MKIAIVEDQKTEQERLKAYIETYCRANNLTADVTCFSDGLDITSDYQPLFDVIYLDVEMGIMDGMTTAQKIRQVDKEVVIVFVTNHSQVAIQGYSVEATDFLLKPLNQFVFEEHFKKILRKLSSKEKESQFLYIKSKSTTTKVVLDDIFYIESVGHSLHIHTKKGTITTSNTLKNMESLLDSSLFFRSNSGYIVNLAYVEKVDGNTAYVHGEPLQISRPRKKDFMAALTNFVGDTLL